MTCTARNMSGASGGTQDPVRVFDFAINFTDEEGELQILDDASTNGAHVCVTSEKEI
eukprot:gene12783-3742_t